jgi:hypothetical protein
MREFQQGFDLLLVQSVIHDLLNTKFDAKSPRSASQTTPVRER